MCLDELFSSIYLFIILKYITILPYKKSDDALIELYIMF